MRIMGVSLFPDPRDKERGDLGEFGTRAPLLAAPLRPWIASVQAFSMSEARPRVFARLPESAASLVVCARDDGSLGVVAVGPRLRAFYKVAAKVPAYTGFTFRSGAARLFLDVPLHELSERAVPIEELWGAHAADLSEAVSRARGCPRATIRAVESALLERLARARSIETRAKLVIGAARALEASSDATLGIPGVARRVGVSERQLRQLFHEDVGVSPKRFARIARIRRAVANAGRVGWAALAAENGFYDQAHLNAEFRDLLGTTPRAFAAGDVPVGAENCSR
jgi:AraC-like DNA-binding protein